jgi:ribosomal protein S12 methylthiotransferase accessory factor
LVEMNLQYNDNTVERGLFYQAMHAVLEVTLDEDLELEDYRVNFTRMFGKDVMENVVGSITGDMKFFGLTPTSIKLEGLDKHLRLIESYKKLHQVRATKAGIS